MLILNFIPVKKQGKLWGFPDVVDTMQECVLA